MSESKASEWLFSQHSLGEDQEVVNSAITIAVTSGKGGVGKTSIAVKFSKILSQMDKKVLLIDCDYNLSNTAIKLGLPVTNKFSEHLDNDLDFDECLHSIGSLDILPTCNGSLEIHESKQDISSRIISYIMQKEHSYDYILLDCPAGMDKGTMSLNSYCDHRFVVVTPDKASITDSYSLIKVLNKRYGVRANHLFVNKVRETKDYKRVVRVMSETIGDFLGVRVQILGGLAQENISPNDFDKLIVGEEKSSFHKTFYKLVAKFTEKLDVHELRETRINEDAFSGQKKQDALPTIC